MAAITSENRVAWQRLADDVAPQRPSAGKLVSVEGGRKHRGKFGVVVRHTPSRYDYGARYRSEAQGILNEMVGRAGWVCLVRESETGEEFWISAEHLLVIQD